MKLILENWRKFLKEDQGFGEGEPPNKEGWYKKQTIIVEDEVPVYSFDFDNTLIRYHTLEDGDVIYLGPHDKNIQLLKDLAAEGIKIIIVTSRSKLKGEKKPWDDTPTPEEAIVEFELPVEEVYYTHGDFKAEKLIELGVSKHWDDDEEEVEAAEAAGIEAVLVPTEEGITDRLRNKWLDHNEEMKKARETTN